MTTSLFLNLWLHYVLAHSRVTVEWRGCKPISNQLSSIPNTLQKAVELAQETGASTWLTALPIAKHGFVLHKGVCARNFTPEHPLSCHYGGLPTIHHDEVRNIKAHLMNYVCHNVGLEPILQLTHHQR